MEISVILARLDEDTLAEFLSKSAFKVLKQLDPKLLRLSVLSKLIQDKISKDEMLRNSNTRTRLFQTMRQNEINELATILGISNTDNILEALITTRFHKNSTNEKKLFDFFNTSIPEETVFESDDVNVIEKPDRCLFDHQYTAMKNLEDHLNNGNRAILHMPTGAGKTRTAMRLIVSDFLKNKSAVVIWLAYSEELCEQAAKEFEKTWQVVGDRNNVKIIRFFRKRNPDVLSLTQNHTGIFLVAGLSKTYNKAKRDSNFLSTLADRASLVVIDEAHQAIANTYQFVLEQLIEKNHSTRLLGLSATPGRTHNSEKLADFFNRKKATIDDPDPVKFLIREGYIAKPDSKSIPYNLSDMTSQERTKIEKAYDIPDDVLEKLAKEEQRNIIIIQEIENLITENHKRILVFAATVKHAQDIAIILSARGHHASYITSSTPDHVRKNIITGFQKATDDNVNKILCNFGVLTMGFDAPQISAVVIARPTKSLVLYSQMIGRAIRGKKAGGTDRCSIRTVVDSSLKDIVVADAFLNWEEIWN